MQYLHIGDFPFKYANFEMVKYYHWQALLKEQLQKANKKYKKE